MQITCCPKDQVRKVWMQFRERIRHAMKRGGLSSYGDVAEAVLDGYALLWVVWDECSPSHMPRKVYGVGVTQTSITEWSKVCTVIAYSGEDRSRWLHLLGVVEDYARAEGCNVVRICGRRGWARVLRDYRAKHVILEKEIA
jgi:hypothetical protein